MGIELKYTRFYIMRHLTQGQAEYEETAVLDLDSAHLLVTNARCLEFGQIIDKSEQHT